VRRPASRFAYWSGYLSEPDAVYPVHEALWFARGILGSHINDRPSKWEFFSSDEKGRLCHIAHPGRHVDGDEPLISLRCSSRPLQSESFHLQKRFSRRTHRVRVAENSFALLRNGLRSVRLLIVGYIPIFDQRDERLAAVLATDVFGHLRT
jgi:hypothetical protein